MASLWKREQSPYWFACFTGPRGERLKKSTKQTDRKKALIVCMEWARAAQRAGQGTLTAAQARKVVSEIVERSGGQPIAFQSIEEWLQTWVDGKGQTKAKDTARCYRQVVRDFLAYLGERARLNLAQVMVADLHGFRRVELTSGKSPRTCNLLLTILGAAFDAARRQGLIVSNPVEALESLPEETIERDVFTPGATHRHLRDGRR